MPEQTANEPPPVSIADPMRPVRAAAAGIVLITAGLWAAMGLRIAVSPNAGQPARSLATAIAAMTPGWVADAAEASYGASARCDWRLTPTVPVGAADAGRPPTPTAPGWLR